MKLLRLPAEYLKINMFFKKRKQEHQQLNAKLDLILKKIIALEDKSDMILSHLDIVLDTLEAVHGFEFEDELSDADKKEPFSEN